MIAFQQENYVLNHIPVTTEKKTNYLALEKAMSHFKAPGVSFAVIENNKIIWQGFAGYTSAQRTQKVDSQTVFQAASLSKTITAVTALRLVSKGVLNLNTSVNEKLKRWKVPIPSKWKKSPVTLRQLLSMSAGVNVGGFFGTEENIPIPSLLNTLEGKKSGGHLPGENLPVAVTAKPGSKFSYSGGGYEVIELLIEDTTAKSFASEVQEMVFDPLKMNQSSCIYPKTKNNTLATDDKGNSFLYRWRIVPTAAGGIWTTPTNLAQMLIALMQSYQGKSKFLPKKLVNEAFTRSPNTPYGLGFVVAGQGKNIHFMKVGQNSGYQGWLVGFPKTGQGAVVLTNSDNGRELAQALIFAFARVYHWPTDGTLQDVPTLK